VKCVFCHISQAIQPASISPKGKARLPHRRERALDVIAAVCVVIVATRLLLRALPRQLAAVQLYFADMQVCTLRHEHPDRNIGQRFAISCIASAFHGAIVTLE